MDDRAQSQESWTNINGFYRLIDNRVDDVILTISLDPPPESKTIIACPRHKIVSQEEEAESVACAICKSAIGGHRYSNLIRINEELDKPEIYHIDERLKPKDFHLQPSQRQPFLQFADLYCEPIWSNGRPHFLASYYLPSRFLVGNLSGFGEVSMQTITERYPELRENSASAEKKVDELEKKISETAKQIGEAEKNVEKYEKMVDENIKQSHDALKWMNKTEKKINKAQKKVKTFRNNLNETGKNIDKANKTSKRRLEELEKMCIENDKKINEAENRSMELERSLKSLEETLTLLS